MKYLFTLLDREPAEYLRQARMRSRLGQHAHYQQRICSPSVTKEGETLDLGSSPNHAYGTLDRAPEKNHPTG